MSSLPRKTETASMNPNNTHRTGYSCRGYLPPRTGNGDNDGVVHVVHPDNGAKVKVNDDESRWEKEGWLIVVWCFVPSHLLTPVSFPFYPSQLTGALNT